MTNPSQVIEFSTTRVTTTDGWKAKIAKTVQREEFHAFTTERVLCDQTESGQAFTFGTSDQFLIEYIPRLEKLYGQIMESEESPVAQEFMAKANRSVFRLTKLGKQVLAACNAFPSDEAVQANWQEAYAHHQFHPVVAVMLRAVMRWHPAVVWWCQHSRGVPLEGANAESVEALDNLVGYIRQVCRTQAFLNLLHDHERKAQDNFRSGCDHVINLFKRHARLLVLRVDLYFRPNAKGWGYSDAADEAMAKYLRALRSCRIVPGYRGFIVKRENGIARGMHYHLMVFLDGHLHQSTNYLTQTLGEEWMRRVGADRASYFNCYSRADSYRYNGLGLVHVSDMEKIIGIRIALWYMSKQDSALKVDGARAKNFWRSWKIGGGDNRGAPRKNDDGMDVVKRLLCGKRSKYPPGFEPANAAA